MQVRKSYQLNNCLSDPEAKLKYFFKKVSFKIAYTYSWKYHISV